MWWGLNALGALLGAVRRPVYLRIDTETTYTWYGLRVPEDWIEIGPQDTSKKIPTPVSYTHLRAHET